MTLLLPIAALLLAPPLNPRAADLFANDPVLKTWAIAGHDSNGDGWLTLFEAQAAAEAFRAIADRDRDERVSVAEYRDARAYLAARHNLADAAAAISPPSR